MVLRMERKAFWEMLTTYVPSAMLMATTFATIFFEFSDAVGTLMTIILVMQGIFTSKIETLPPSSDMKMLDIWLIGCFVYPFIEMILRTIRENYEQKYNYEVQRNGSILFLIPLEQNLNVFFVFYLVLNKIGAFL